MKFLSLVLGSVLATAAFAWQDETALVVPTTKASTFHYGYTSENYEQPDGDYRNEEWYSVRSGYLAGAIDRELQKYRLRVNANAADLLGLQNVSGVDFLKRIQFEAGGETGRAPYGLIATEMSFVKPVNFLVGSVHNPGGNQKFIMGPIVYWSNSHSLLFFFPRASKSESPVEHTMVLRNRIREFGNLAWLDLDASHKWVEKDERVEEWCPYGYGVAFGFWKVYGKYSVVPYWEGNKLIKTAYEVGVDASF